MYLPLLVYAKEYGFEYEYALKLKPKEKIRNI